MRVCRLEVSGTPSLALSLRQHTLSPLVLSKICTLSPRACAHASRCTVCMHSCTLCLLLCCRSIQRSHVQSRRTARASPTAHRLVRTPLSGFERTSRSLPARQQAHLLHTAEPLTRATHRVDARESVAAPPVRTRLFANHSHPEPLIHESQSQRRQLGHDCPRTIRTPNLSSRELVAAPPVRTRLPTQAIAHERQ